MAPVLDQGLQVLKEFRCFPEGEETESCLAKKEGKILLEP